MIRAEKDKKIEDWAKAPESVQFIIETHCPLNCSFCDQQCSRESFLERLTPKSDSIESEEEFWEQREEGENRLLQVVDHLGEWGIRKVTLTGGEPTLVNVRKLLIRAKAYGMETSLATSGVGIAFPPREWSTLAGGIIVPNLLDRIYPFLDVLKLSLHGAEREIHDEIVGFHSFDHVVAVLRESQRHHRGDFRTEVTCVVTQRNREEIPGILEICSRFEVSQLTLNEVYPRGRGRDFVGQVAGREIEQIKNWLEKQGPNVKIVVRKPDPSCVLVYPEGGVFVSHCQTPSGLYSLGNLLDGNMAEFWRKFPGREQFMTNYQRLNR